MNHIARLQTDLATAKAEVTAKNEVLQAFRVHLDGEKFHGVDADGSRKDWIAVADVLAWISIIKNAGT
jgi:hypothetical protein